MLCGVLIPGVDIKCWGWGTLKASGSQATVLMKAQVSWKRGLFDFWYTKVRIEELRDEIKIVSFGWYEPQMGKG